MTRLQAQDLGARVLEHRHRVVGDHVVACRAVGEDAVRELEADVVARANVVDPGERREVGRAMSRDVDQVPFTG